MIATSFDATFCNYHSSRYTVFVLKSQPSVSPLPPHVPGDNGKILGSETKGHLVVSPLIHFRLFLKDEIHLLSYLFSSLLLFQVDHAASICAATSKKRFQSHSYVDWHATSTPVPAFQLSYIQNQLVQVYSLCALVFTRPHAKRQDTSSYGRSL
jgi:hypothetical protein